MARDLNPSASQSATYEAYGNAEDYSKLITNIEPDQTKFLSSFREAPDAKATEFSWTTEGLRPPQDNAHFEKEDYVSQKVGSMEGLSNCVQNFQNTGYVTDTQRKVNKIYNEQDEFVRQVKNAMIGQARDMEYMLVNGKAKQLGSESVKPRSGGIPYFMSMQNIDCTLTVADGIVSTGAVKHNLTTGDFVYFIADTMPTGLKQGLLYYVRVDATTPETKFTLYDALADAVEGKTSAQVKPTTTGTALKIVKNNIIDLGGADDLSTDNMNDVMQMCYNRGGNPTKAIMSGAKKRRFSSIVGAIGQTKRKSGEHKMDIVVDVFQSDFGTITAEAHRMYPDNRIDFMDSQYWELKYLTRPHEVKDLAKKGSYTEFVLEAQLGLQGTQPKASGSLINIKR